MRSAARMMMVQRQGNVLVALRLEEVVRALATTTAIAAIASAPEATGVKAPAHIALALVSGKMLGHSFISEFRDMESFAWHGSS